MDRKTKSLVICAVIAAAILLLMIIANFAPVDRQCPWVFPKILSCLLSARETLFAGLTAAGGALFAAWLAFDAVQEQIREEREREKRLRAQELAELKKSFYAEIADRAARCLNDYLKPWENFQIKDEDSLSAERVGRFRPMAAVVCPGNAGRLGRFDARALLAVTQFYFRLEAFSLAIESVVTAREKDENSNLRFDETWRRKDEKRVKHIETRLRPCFEPALNALKALNVAERDEFDQAAVREYPWLQERLGASGSLHGALDIEASKWREARDAKSK